MSGAPSASSPSPRPARGPVAFRACCAFASAVVLASLLTPALPSPTASPAYAEPLRTYVVAPGDTLWSIARRFGLSVDTLVAANGLANPDRIAVGQQLVLSTEAAAVPQPAPGQYTVAPGDTLWSIARRFGTTPEAIVQANGLLNADRIFPGQALRIPTAGEVGPGDPAATDPSVRSYAVLPGDTVWSIARRFGLSVDTLVAANGLANPDRIAAGQVLLIPVPGAAPPAPGQRPLGSRPLLQGHRMVTYYGIPGKPTMGILGQLSPEELVRSLKARAAEAAAAGGKPVVPAVQLVAVQAMREAGSDGKYRRRLAPSVIREYVDLAAATGLQVILDLQIGGSSLDDEIAALLPFLEQPHVHLALDPEYAMPPGVAPGTRTGSLDAGQINAAQETLARLVEQKGLPNKVLMVHEFRTGMVTGKAAIVNHPLVDIVFNMDGQGSQAEKIKKYRDLIASQPVEYTSMQIFLRHDSSPFTPAQALALTPAPDVLVYF
ncbi:MAG: LysM peptidoglycan-binding domain-containing protein [Chloroflexi bacterium]|nr:LysM peptidoglycan-binding domain-containing protein [Chloroflexota bacterium]